MTSVMTLSPATPRKISWIMLAVSGAILFTLMILSSLHKPLSFDEPHNLDYGYQFITQGPHTVTTGQRMPMLALNALPCLSFQCDLDTLQTHEFARMMVRLPSMIAALVLGWILWRWAFQLYGEKSAMLTAFLYALNPNIIAHGKQITSDIFTSLFVVLTVYWFWRYQKQRHFRYWWLCLFAAGASMIAKFSSLLVIFILMLLWILNKFLLARAGTPMTKHDGFRALSLGIGFCVGLLLIINATYLFDGSFKPANKEQWQSETFKKLAAANAIIPFPYAFNKGVDYSFLIEERDEFGRGNNYILGKRHRKGRWYAFPLMILFKTPLAFFVLLGWGFAQRPRMKTAGLPDAFFLGIPFLAWLIVFSVGCDVQVGLRYILPSLPFLMIYAGSAVSTSAHALSAGIKGFLIGWYALSTLSYHPHYIPYFNELIGDRVNAYKYLSDSNLDWEDKQYFIDRFKARYPGLVFQEAIEAMKNPKPGFFLIPAMSYTGVIDEPYFAWLRLFKPLRHVDYSHYLFYISPEEFAKATAAHPVPPMA